MSEPITRRGDWMQTYTGRAFWPMSPRPEDVDIEDIAHSLSMQCRYAGHCVRFYSVAEHCVLLSRAVAPEHALWALLHDASEAYLVDVPRPVKPFLNGYQDAEEAVMRVVASFLCLPGDLPAEVKAADWAILTDEFEQNMGPAPISWRLGPRLGVTLRFWEPARAEHEFMLRFNALMEGVA